MSTMQELAPGTETINFRVADVRKTLKEVTDGRGPDVGIEAAGFHYVQGLMHKVPSTAVSLLSCNRRGYFRSPPACISGADCQQCCIFMVSTTREIQQYASAS
jgi:threonine dehydrogenase-like Zn-dependent dehydrogenase